MNKLKQEIFDKVKEYYDLVHKNKTSSHIPVSGKVYDEKEMQNIVDSALDFNLTSGKYADQFEKEFANFLNIKHCLLTNSGSSANLLAISALTSPLLKERQLHPEDEVITTACCFPTTVNPIIQNNLIPVFIDVDLGSYNIQYDKIESAITEKTKAIFLAHTLGNPFNLDVVTDICKKYRLWLVEDVCDALGSKYNDQYTGTFGDISTYSFFPAHMITTGEGGALCTNNYLLKRIIESMRDWGRDCNCLPGCDNTCGKRFSQKLGNLPFGYDHKYIYSHIGYNLKITEMQAAIGVAQLEKLPRFIELRKRNFNLLYKSLQKHFKYFILPIPEPHSDPSWFGFLLTVKEDAGFTKNEIVSYLESNKIATRQLFSGNITKHPSFKNVKSYSHLSLKNSDTIMNSTFWIGVYPAITTENIFYITQIFDKFIEGLK